uniref:Uncharacterized protein n=1 Tax=Romanomermis culicivorax TaxID=13658 RepID=A0A915HUK8_ROMCU
MAMPTQNLTDEKQQRNIISVGVMPTALRRNTIAKHSVINQEPHDIKTGDTNFLYNWFAIVAIGLQLLPAPAKFQQKAKFLAELQLNDNVEQLLKALVPNVNLEMSEGSNYVVEIEDEVPSEVEEEQLAPQSPCINYLQFCTTMAQSGLMESGRNMIIAASFATMPPTDIPRYPQPLRLVPQQHKHSMSKLLLEFGCPSNELYQRKLHSRLRSSFNHKHRTSPASSA